MSSFRLSAIGFRLSAVGSRLSAISSRLLPFAFCLLPFAAAAQTSEPDARPAFSLSTSQVFTTKDAPNFYLTFRRIPTLDVRVYKVKDPFAFFASLKDPHQLGSEEPFVPQERSWIERLADWKRRQRQEVQSFARGQVSRTYRASRRASTDKSTASQRVTLNVNTFAQVPLLNPDQLVTSWRELLPNHRDPEVRRVPLEVKTPGIFVVEAVHELLRAYTVVIVSDVGLVTKTSPGQLVMFAANRFNGEPAAGCGVRVLASQKTVGQGQTSADGLFETSLPDEKLDDVIGVAQCGDQMAATDPGSWSLQQPARELVGYIYTDKPIYRPGHTVRVKAVLRWKRADALVAFDRPETPQM